LCELISHPSALSKHQKKVKKKTTTTTT